MIRGDSPTCNSCSACKKITSRRRKGEYWCVRFPEWKHIDDIKKHFCAQHTSHLLKGKLAINDPSTFESEESLRCRTDLGKALLM